MLFGPILLLMGSSWLVAALVIGGAIYCAWNYTYTLDTFGWLREQEKEPPFVWMAFVTGLPVLFAPFAALMRGRDTRADFWRRVEQLALTYAVVGASLASSFASMGGYSGDDGLMAAGPMLVRAVVALLAGALVVAARPGLSGMMSGAIIAGAGLVMALAYWTNDVDLLAALLFMALWLGIAAAALVAGWRGVFQLAVAAIALRLIVLSFELASDLLLSGFGLIVSGLLIIGIAYAALRVSREFAPRSEHEDEEPPEGGEA
ncbi:hypothetical protein ACI5KX_00615 [Erythrobacter sp. GH1-10]|uniref:hypothetical protein n=1 Tax=Erythrobacter sp. GH1-10 TaxID=3349334 RepID=UPI0038779A57